MRIIIICICLIGISCGLYARGLTSNATLIEVSQSTQIPVKKLKTYLELAADVSNDATLHDLNISLEKVNTLEKKFSKDIIAYARSITMVGMIVVFVSLIFTGIFIGLLKFAAPKNKKNVKIVKSRHANNEGISANAIVAAITALHIHMLEVEQDPIMLTWKRVANTTWQNFSRMKMPNKEFSKERRT